MNTAKIIRRFVLAASLALASLVVVGPAAAAPDSADEVALCQQIDLVSALAELDSGLNLGVVAGPQDLVIFDRSTGETLLVADRAGSMYLEAGTLRRPALGRQADTRVASAATVDQTPIYTRSVTSRGARLLVIEPGEVNELGLEILLFEGDDFVVTDGQGEVLYASRTNARGELVERSAGCERRTLRDGRVTLAPVR